MALRDLSLPVPASARHSDADQHVTTSCRLSPDLISHLYLLTLRGVIDLGVERQVRRALAMLPPGPGSLTIDLMAVTHLDCALLGLLLDAQHSLAPLRPIIFRVPDTGSVRRLIGLLGLEERMGLHERDTQACAIDP